MGASFVIALREGIEAALIVSIVLAYLKQVGASDRSRLVWWGAGLAVVLSAALGTAIFVAGRRIRRDGRAGLRGARDARRGRRADVDDLLDASSGIAHQVRAPGEGRYRAGFGRPRARRTRVLRRPAGGHRDRALPVRRREGNRRRRHAGRARGTGVRSRSRSRARGGPRCVAVSRRHPYEPAFVLPRHWPDLDRRLGGVVRLLVARASGSRVAALPRIAGLRPVRDPSGRRRPRRDPPRSRRATTPIRRGSKSSAGPRISWWSAACSSGHRSCPG